MNTHVGRWMLIGGLTAGLLVLIALMFHGWDWDFFAHIGYRLPNGDGTVFSGYDGQFAYFIARDVVDAIPHLDVPAYRLQRIVYPMTAWLFAGGQARAVPVSLVLVNVAAVALGTGAFALLVRRESAPAWVPILFIAWIGIGQTLLYDLNEILTVALSLWAWVFWQRGQTHRAGILFGIGALAKDLAFLFAVPTIVYAAIRHDWRNAARLLLWAFAPYIAWLILLRVNLSAWSFSAHAIEFEIMPFGGLRGADATLPLVIAFLIVPGMIVLIYALQHLDHVYALATIASYLFLVFLPVYSYAGSAVFRLTTPLVLSAILLFAEQRQTRWLVLLTSWWSCTGVLALMIAISP